MQVCVEQRTATQARKISERLFQVRLESVQILLPLRNIYWTYLPCFYVCPAGCRSLQDLEVKHVEVDACGDAQSAAEGAILGLFQYDQLKAKKKNKVITQLYER